MRHFYQPEQLNPNVWTQNTSLEGLGERWAGVPLPKLKALGSWQLPVVMSPWQQEKKINGALVLIQVPVKWNKFVFAR